MASNGVLILTRLFCAESIPSGRCSNDMSLLARPTFRVVAPAATIACAFFILYMTSVGTTDLGFCLLGAAGCLTLEVRKRLGKSKCKQSKTVAASVSTEAAAAGGSCGSASSFQGSCEEQPEAAKASVPEPPVRPRAVAPARPWTQPTRRGSSPRASPASSSHESRRAAEEHEALVPALERALDDAASRKALAQRCSALCGHFELLAELAQIWAQDFGVVGRTGHLTPYAWTVMIAYFLQVGAPGAPALPPLSAAGGQRRALGHPEGGAVKPGAAARELGPAARASDAAPPCRAGDSSEEGAISLAEEAEELFGRMMVFYGNEFEWHSEGVSVICGYRAPAKPELKPHVVLSDGGFSLEVCPNIVDPLLPSRNLSSNMTAEGLSRLRDEIMHSNFMCSIGMAPSTLLKHPWRRLPSPDTAEEQGKWGLLAKRSSVGGSEPGAEGKACCQPQGPVRDEPWHEETDSDSDEEADAAEEEEADPQMSFRAYVMLWLLTPQAGIL